MENLHKIRLILIEKASVTQPNIYSLAYSHPPLLRMAEKAADFVDSPHTFIFERNPYTHSTIVMSKHKTFKYANGIFQVLNFFLLLQNVSPSFKSHWLKSIFIKKMGHFYNQVDKIMPFFTPSPLTWTNVNIQLTPNLCVCGLT